MNDDVEFSLTTKEYGKIDFAPWVVWREMNLHRIVHDPHDTDPKTLVTNIAKCDIHQIRDKFYLHESFEKIEDYKRFENIDLKLKDNEIEEFSELFLENNDYLLGNSKSYILINDVPIPPTKRDAEKFKKIDSQKSFLLKLYYSWILNYDEQRKRISNIFEFPKIPKAIDNSLFSNYLSKFSIPHNKYPDKGIAETLFKNDKVAIPIIKPSGKEKHKEKTLVSLRGHSNEIEIQEEKQTEELKIVKTILQDQIQVANMQSSSAKRDANIAFKVSVVSFLVAFILSGASAYLTFLCLQATKEQTQLSASEATQKEILKALIKSNIQRKKKAK